MLQYPQAMQVHIKFTIITVHIQKLLYTPKGRREKKGGREESIETKKKKKSKQTRKLNVQKAKKFHFESEDTHLTSQ